MRTSLLWVVGLTCGCFLASPLPAQDPLRLVPAHADAVVKIENPRRVVESILDHHIVKELLKIDAVQELYDTTNARRLYQLLAHVEKQLGHDRMELLDRLAGGGIGVGAQFSGKKPSALLIVQGKDEELQRKFVKLALEIAEAELARQEVKERPKKSSYRGVEVIEVNKQFYVAVAGSALLAASDGKALQGGLDLHLDGNKKSVLGVARLREGRALLLPQPLAWGWVDLESVRRIPAVKTALDTVSANPQNTFLLGGAFDLFKRAPFLSAGVHQQGSDFLASVRLPVGRAGMGKTASLFVPPDQHGSLPLLEPRHVLASTSYYLDAGAFWDNRAKLLNEQQLMGLEQFDENSGRFLGGTRLSTLLKQAGVHQRIVVAQPTTSSYKKVPTTKIPAFAIVVEMREPAFAQNMEAVLRAAGLLASTQASLKMKQEKQGDVTIVSYLFPEVQKGPIANDIVFNFSPSFAASGKQFIVSSTVELARELVDLVGKEKDIVYSPAVSRTHLYAAGAAALLRSFEDQLLAQAILGQGVPLGTGKSQIDSFIRLVEQVGTLQLEEHYGAKDFRYDLRWQHGKK
jgi:hypothetical protein